MHDFQQATAQAVPQLLAELKAGGYKIVHMKAQRRRWRRCRSTTRSCSRKRSCRPSASGRPRAWCARSTNGIEFAIATRAARRAAPLHLPARRISSAAIMARPDRIEGLAIVSADGMIADASGVQPDALKLEADQRFFHAMLDEADALVHGRNSGEGGPHMARRRRLILTRRDRRPRPRSGERQGGALEPGGRHARAGLGRARPVRRPAGRHRRHRGVRPVPRARLRRLPPEPRQPGPPARRPAGVSRHPARTRPKSCWRSTA